jgi:hypothetical protein
MFRQEFEARLECGGEGGAWTLFTVPFSVEQAFGTRGRVAVVGTINGVDYGSSLMPLGDGTHCMLVNKALQRGAGVAPGDTVRVVMEPDTAPRTVTLPSDLQAAFADHPGAAAAFEKLPYSHQKQYVDWIEGAKQAETRARRVEKALGMLVDGKKLNG